ncbi:phage terminase small subunit [Alkalicoccobacillus plakortidis]|uniref:Phage terminase small subunit n=1 Tax=Alkalicoccobacillus plakortidis TaxID=444060 RepID=A0ABT0XFV5_9BACI|nr:phage terminase small subunit [Alkalicoccobacillus plakortidis]MCM2674082.1 phage terminase small subunit [Alkalicoccobacillus plakortidis]
MARGRSPKRDEALRLWLDSSGQAKLVDIAEQVGVSASQIRKWKNQDDWEGVLNGNVTNETNGNVTKRGAPQGNKNAVGNEGGAPQGNRNAAGNIGGFAPLGNKNARTTGEYESILFDELDDKEKELFYVVDASPYAQIDENIRVLTIREKRMLQRIKLATEGLNEKEIRVLKQRRNVKQSVEFEDPNTYKKTKRIVDGYKMVPVEEETTQFRKIDDILKLEDALSRVQTLKQKAIKQYFEMTHVFDHKQHIDTERLALDKKKAQKEKDINESLKITIKRKEARAGETND